MRFFTFAVLDYCFLSDKCSSLSETILNRFFGRVLSLPFTLSSLYRVSLRSLYAKSAQNDENYECPKAKFPFLSRTISPFFMTLCISRLRIYLIMISYGKCAGLISLIALNKPSKSAGTP